MRAGLALPGLAAVLALLASGAPAFAVGERALAEIKGRDGTSLGTLTLVETMAGVLMTARLTGLPPGPHGIHIHQTGRCEGDFASAGAIHNPLGASHGFMNPEGPMVGDLPNITAGPDGEVEAELLAPFATLSPEAQDSLSDADGASIVIFAGADDHFSEPEGGSGERIACGVITLQP
jgi:superoxide dismutase, Cu-Zn family